MNFSATLPRHLHRAVLRLLRPAEAATRRLVIVAARGVVVPPPPPPRRRKANPAPTILRNGVGTGILMPRGIPGTVYFFPHNGAAGSGPDISGKKVNCPLRLKGEGVAHVSESPSPLWGGVRGGGKSAPARPLTLPLFDPLRPPSVRRPVAASVPRISVPGYSTPAAIVPRRAPAPGDPVDAARLGRRLAALAAALDDLPRQAKRFARWRAHRDAIIAQERNGDTAAQTGASRRLPHGRRRPRRIWPLRPGRPPGWRRKPKHEVHEVLNVVHGLAFWALERRDTS